MLGGRGAPRGARGAPRGRGAPVPRPAPPPPKQDYSAPQAYEDDSYSYVSSHFLTIMAFPILLIYLVCSQLRTTIIYVSLTHYNVIL